MKRLLIIFTLAAMASCVPLDIEEVLLQRDDISLTMRGEVLVSYNPLTCQLAHNRTTNEFRVFDDRLSENFILKCEEKPAVAGQEFNADLTWTAGKSTRTLKGLTMRVEKIDNDGKIWLWNNGKNIGIVVKNL